MELLLFTAGFLLLLLLVVGFYHANKKLPQGLSFAGPERSASDLHFLRDLTWMDEEGRMQKDHEIFNTIVSMINGANRFILLDMFLFNHFTGSGKSVCRLLSRELADTLVIRKKKNPAIEMTVITDPVNTVYGGLNNPMITELEEHGIRVIVTRLDSMRDSNIIYSPLWRVLFKPFGNGKGCWLPNPFGPGSVSVRSYLAMFNFKANHRKVIITDSGESYWALVTSLNPHDGSSSHGNTAVRFSGRAVTDLLASEYAVLSFSTDDMPELPEITVQEENGGCTVQVLTEGAIKMTLLSELAGCGEGDSVALVMFYLSDRDVVQALLAMQQRGVKLRVLLDPNKDAFGLEKNGIPNRQVAAELAAANIPVRWGNTHGEQLHAKLVLIDRKSQASFLLQGSANLTRRNLENYNLETDVAVRCKRDEEIVASARKYFELLWTNDGNRVFSVEYQCYSDSSFLRRISCGWMEATGMCTF